MSETRNLTMAPLWSGVIVTALFGYIATRLWFVPALLLIVVVALTASSRRGTRSSD